MHITNCEVTHFSPTRPTSPALLQYAILENVSYILQHTAVLSSSRVNFIWSIIGQHNRIEEVSKMHFCRDNTLLTWLLLFVYVYSVIVHMTEEFNQLTVLAISFSTGGEACFL